MCVLTLECCLTLPAMSSVSCKDITIPSPVQQSALIDAGSPQLTVAGIVFSSFGIHSLGIINDFTFHTSQNLYVDSLIIILNVQRIPKIQYKIIIFLVFLYGPCSMDWGRAQQLLHFHPIHNS